MAVGGQVVVSPPKPADLLPIEIGFLAAHGIPVAVLREAARVALRTGVSPDEALLRGDLVDEETFYRALADEVGLPYFDREVAAGALTRFPESITAGILPLAAAHHPARFALAPRGPALTRLLRRPLVPDGLAIVAPTTLHRAVFHACADAIAAHAADDLAEAQPHLSYRGGCGAGQIALATAAAAILAPAAWLAPDETASIVAMLATPLFLATVVFRIAAAVDPPPIAPVRALPRWRERDLPVYTIIVPLYREGRVVGRLLDALRRLDYPAEKLDIKLVIEADDGDTAAALAAADVPGCCEVVTAPPGRPRTKPRALNVALPLARGDYTVVYDAEDVPDPDQLRLAVATFARMPAEVACLQARLAIDNTADGWLARLFTLEYAALFDVINPELARSRFPVPLGGTSNHFRTAVLRRLRGWDARNVTEDADLGLRLALGGWRVADLPSTTLEEAPATLSGWMSQRARWMKGYMQVCITHSRRPLRALRALGPMSFAAAVTTTFGTVAAALGFPFFATLAAHGLWSGRLLDADHMAPIAWAAVGLTLFASGFAALVLPALAGLARRRWWGLVPALALMPVYHVLISAAAWRGLVELVRDSAHWNKTEHGLARTSRAGLLTGRRADPWPPRRPAGRAGTGARKLPSYP